MISNDVLQKALITRLKAAVAVTTILNGSTEVREQQWQGRTFTYPSVRVALTQQVPRPDMSPCEWSVLSFSILCFSEERSSAEADQLAGAVNANLHESAWTVIADNFRFHKIRSVGLNSAIRMSERIWRAEAAFVARLHTV